MQPWLLEQHSADHRNLTRVDATPGRHVWFTRCVCAGGLAVDETQRLQDELTGACREANSFMDRYCSVFILAALPTSGLPFQHK